LNKLFFHNTLLDIDEMTIDGEITIRARANGVKNAVRPSNSRIPLHP